MPPAHDQSERELIYRALLELKNELREIKTLLNGRTNGSHANHFALPASSLSNEENSIHVPSLEEIEREIHEIVQKKMGSTERPVTASIQEA